MRLQFCRVFLGSVFWGLWGVVWLFCWVEKFEVKKFLGAILGWVSLWFVIATRGSGGGRGEGRSRLGFSPRRCERPYDSDRERSGKVGIGCESDRSE